MMLSVTRARASFRRIARQVQQTAHRHPRRIAATAAVVMSGFAVTAFGIAPMAPDAAQLPQRLVVEELAVRDDLAAQVEALAAHDLQLTRADVSRANDTVDGLLRRLGVADPSAAAFIRADINARRLVEGRAGKLVQARFSRDGSLVSLVARYAVEGDAFLSQFNRLTIDRAEGGAWRARIEQAALVAEPKLASGTIRSSLFAATDEAGMPDSIASQMAEMFSTDIDFHRQLRKGDTFSVVYETLTADGQPITWGEGVGRVLAAEFINAGRAYQAVWFSTAPGKGGYFGYDGQSRRRAFLASPLEFSRVTSGFAMRFHPILQTWRAHLGVDYGAPTGTPVRSVGEGTVDFAGWQNGYGNVVTIKHDAKRSTTYAHLSRIDVRKGQRLEQGQRVGAVGATGWATGPHLHFEFRVDGAHRDPLEIARSAETLALDAAARPRFDRFASVARSQLEAAQAMTGVRVDAE